MNILKDKTQICVHWAIQRNEKYEKLKLDKFRCIEKLKEIINSKNNIHAKFTMLIKMKIDNYKLYEYAYNELPEEQVKEVEQYILNNPEALNLVNEYLNFKYDLESIPKDKLDLLK